jgi:glycosyltransferase involved in cell wall biosynthesis
LLNVTVPTFNEQACLVPNVRRLVAFLDGLAVSYEVVIADNGSTDETLALARGLAGELKNVRVLHLDERGRGRALKAAWKSSQARLLTYMDADLSTDLEGFEPLMNSLLAGRCDLAIGSRLLQPELTKRSLKREFISRSYIFLLKRLLNVRFSDAQCGFKAITRAAADELLPLVEDNEWFFDTELLVIAEKLGYRIFDLPVPWVEAPDSRVNLARTALQDLRGLFRLRRRLASELSFQRPAKLTPPRSKSKVSLPVDRFTKNPSAF